MAAAAAIRGVDCFSVHTVSTDRKSFPLLPTALSRLEKLQPASPCCKLHFSLLVLPRWQPVIAVCNQRQLRLSLPLKTDLWRSLDNVCDKNLVSSSFSDITSSLLARRSLRQWSDFLVPSSALSSELPGSAEGFTDPCTSPEPLGCIREEKCSAQRPEGCNYTGALLSSAG